MSLRLERVTADITDSAASDLDAAPHRLVGLGPTETGRQSFDGGFQWVVLADPAGNAFCVAAPQP